MSRISVLIPSFNHARYIGEAIRSVEAQTYRDLELIVVDDGSTDGSPDVIRRCLERTSLPRVVFREQPNLGVDRAIARAVDEARGDVLAILNSDDRFAPERLARMAQDIPEGSDFLAFSGVRMIGASGEELGPSTDPVRGYRHALYEASRCPTVGFGLLRNNFAVSSGNLVFSLGLYERLDGFASYTLANDWDFLLRSLFYVEPIFVPEPLLDYRTHEGNTRLRVDELGPQEGRLILNRYLACCARACTENPLAPCERNWPFFFDLFTSRYHAWFGFGPIRDWLDEPPIEAPSPVQRRLWRSWGAAVDFERVDDCAYLTADGADAVDRVSLALAREILVASSHPLAAEEGGGEETLAAVFDRRAYGRPRFQRPPWVATVARHLAPPPDPFLSGDAGQRCGGRWGALEGEERRSLIARCTGQSIRLSRRVGTQARRARGWLRRVRDTQLVRRSEWFDPAYYLEQCTDRARLPRWPAWHYLSRGTARGLDPHPHFDTDFYLEANPDVARAGVNPLVHFLRCGLTEGRAPNRLLTPSPSALSGSARRELWLRLEQGDRVGNADASALAPEPGRDEGLARGIRGSGLFDASLYRHAYGGDLSGFQDEVRHFLARGSIEGFGLGDARKLQRWMRRLAAREGGPELSYLESSPADARPPGRRVAIYASSAGNAFFREMARLIAHAFACAGASASVRDERAPPDALADHHIVVAPHEFFLLGAGPERLSRAFLARSCLWLAEQPGSEFFSMCLWFSRLARCVLDINPLTALAWGALGVPARAFPLGYAAGFEDYVDGLELAPDSVRFSQPPEVREYAGRVDDPLADRPLDVFFNAVLTERRDRFLAANGRLFSGLRCALYLPTAMTPLAEAVPSALDTRSATALAQRSKVVLNVHRGDMPYFEWHRLVVRGIWQKALVVTEPCLPVPGLRPGEHYVECALAEIPQKLQWLLHTPQGRAQAEETRKRAFEALVARFSLPRIASAFLSEQAPCRLEP